MKNLFSKIMFVAVAAMAFASCSNDEIYVTPETEGFEVSINANTTDTTRSAFGDYNADSKTYPTLWEGNEEWFAAINDKYTESIDKITFSDDFKSANANFTLSNVPSASDDGTYTLYAISPASAWSSYHFTDDYLRFYIARNTQTPTAVSCDPASQVLFAKSEAMDSADSFDVNFEHLSAYVKFSFTNVAEGGVVSSVSVTAKDVNLAGRYQYIPSTGELAEYDRLEKSITLVTNSTENLWLAVAPVDVSGKVLTFSITTDKGILSRDVTMPATAKFESGKVVTFNVDMAGIEYPTDEDAETWQLITNVADITDGEYIIVAKNNDGNIVYLPSATNTSSAPTQTVITVTGLDLSNADVFKTTLIPAGARFTFTGSANAVTIANADGKYLYTTSSNNGLRVGNTNNTWKIAAHASVNQSLSLQYSTTDRYIALYNSQDWRCYTTSYGSYTGNNTTQNGVTYLYKKITKDPAISASAIEVEANGGDGKASYSVMNMEDDVTATSTDEWITAMAGNGSILYEVEPNYTGDVRTGKITLSSASKGVTKDVTVTQAADEFKVSKEVVSLDAEANSTATFTVTSTYAAAISVDDAKKWSVSATNIEAGTTEITVTALTANGGEEAIEGTITITRAADSKSIEVAITQNAATAEKIESVTFSEQNYANAQAIELYTGTNFTVTFAKGSNSNAPKYYTSGAAIRCYGGNTFTVSSEKTIIKIELTFGTDDGSNIITASSESYSNGTWTGSSEEVTFIIGGTSGNRRIAGISVTYAE
ncbi:MAG: BACON domain-containing protein [Alistipes sp.]|nr:BACON domain-containing protein [Alistipes sp.]